MITQCDMILEYLRRFGSITPWEALREFGCMRLGARIWDLKNMGHDISVVMVQTKNRLGRTVRYAKYVLHEENATAAGTAEA